MPVYAALPHTDDRASLHGSGMGAGRPALWDYKALPPPCAPNTTDPDLIASWSYDPGQRMMVSYDTPEAETAANPTTSSRWAWRRHVGGIAVPTNPGETEFVWTVANALGAAITPGSIVEQSAGLRIKI